MVANVNDTYEELENTIKALKIIGAKNLYLFPNSFTNHTSTKNQLQKG